jgi:hypothetical protein
MAVSAELDIVQGGHAAIKRDILKGPTDAQDSTPMGGQAGDVAALEENLSCVGMIKATDAVYNGRLTGAIGTTSKLTSDKTCRPPKDKERFLTARRLMRSL